MIMQLLNTVTSVPDISISTVNITQSAKPRSIFNCEHKIKANNISDMKTNQSEKKRSIDVTSNDNTVKNSEALKNHYPSN